MVAGASMALLCQASCGSVAERSGQSELVILNPELLRAYEDYRGTMSVARPELGLADGAVVNTCEAYLQARQRGAAPAEAVNNRIVAADYVICDTLALLGPGRPVAASPDRVDYGRALYEGLDLRSFQSSLGPAVDDQAYLLADLPPGLLDPKVDDRGVASDTDDWFFGLEVVATTDLDGDRIRDWIIWLSDRAKDGTYADFAVLTVTAPDQSRPIPARRVD
jgi:hypothetical protein